MNCSRVYWGRYVAGGAKGKSMYMKKTDDYISHRTSLYLAAVPAVPLRWVLNVLLCTRCYLGRYATLAMFLSTLVYV